ncbi:caspase-6-like isoform X2 [Lytechinus variegatus]|uniref:caspase-6-like isoform X2 n=1 Tax=Lytechinus variegatus TaxID=7654 RepID=UPI001BB1068D|nr:caspase-6-like isoform X2 [Lytechinus variegatus]
MTSFLKGLGNIIDAFDKSANEEFEVTREGRSFKILIEGRFHKPSEPWVYDVTATDLLTNTFQKVKHYDRKEDGVNEAINSVMNTLREKGVTGTHGQTTLVLQTSQPDPFVYNLTRSEQINQALMKMLAKKGFVADPNPETPSGSSLPPPQAYQQIPTSPPQSLHQTRATNNQQAMYGSAKSSQKFPLPENRESVLLQYGIQSIDPDVDGLYTSVIPPAQPDQTILDPRSTYVTWESPMKGFVYILNNSEFPELPERSRIRRGSNVDLENVKHVFSQLGYKPLVHENLKKQEILDSLDVTIDRINKDDAIHSSLCMFFMSHGNQDGISGTDATRYNPSIVTRFEIKKKLSGRKCKALVGKPKLIFFQACRGTTFTRNADELDAIPAPRASFEVDYVPSESNEEPLEVDFIEMDSINTDDSNDLDVDGGGELPDNSEGYNSIRMRRDGSWFIQAISEIFLAHAHQDELNELMRKVTCLVTESYRINHFEEATKRSFEVRQTPAYESQGMRRKFYFLPKYP